MNPPETIIAARGSLHRFVRRVCCVFTGHPCRKTGRHAILLTEWQCLRCDGIFVSHSEHGNALVDADADSDRIFRDYMEAIKTADAYLPND